MRQFIPFAIAYFIWDFISALMKVEGKFQTVHWIMVGMLVIFFVLLYTTGKEAIRDYKVKQAAKAEQQKKAQLEQLSKRKSIYLDELETEELPTIEAEAVDSTNSESKEQLNS